MSASYLEVQLSGLEALYTATGGELWTSSTGWLDNVVGVCSWYGVTCDSSGQNVTALSLPGNGLTGDLADAVELFDVLSLASVDLSNNELVGAVTPGFGLMPGLEVLDLSRNELSSFPASWGAEAWSLQHLSLQLNNISGCVRIMLHNVRLLCNVPSRRTSTYEVCVHHELNGEDSTAKHVPFFPEFIGVFEQ